MEAKSRVATFLKSSQGKRIVFTNGCFDVLHRGHIEYLRQAKLLGDLLVVGLNSDASIRSLKGPSRPINLEQDRWELLSELRSVDQVFVFNEETPLKLIQELKPHVLVKGGDWPVEKIVGADFVLEYGGVVKSLPFLKGYSSTQTIQKMS